MPRLFDGDQHYYEPEDAFLRYADPRIAHRAPRWVELVDGGDKRLVFGDRMNRFLGADHTFSAIAPPGGLPQGVAGRAAPRAELGPPRPEYRERDARLEVMDRQDVETTLLFPTLALSVEQLLVDDVEATYANLRAFNRWLDDDWGFDHQQRIYGVPLLSLLDPLLAVEELERVIECGARVVHLRPGPVAGRSPADRLFDRFWETVSDGDVAVVFHACDDSYRYELAKLWRWGNVNVPARNIPPIQRIIAGPNRVIHDTIASLLYSDLFGRFPRLRIATVELGSSWVEVLLSALDAVGRGDLDEDPAVTFRRHIWVTPFESDDLTGLAGMVGIDRVMFGSDYPHADGLAEPASYRDALKGFDDEEIRKVMHDNARALVPAR